MGSAAMDDDACGRRTGLADYSAEEQQRESSHLSMLAALLWHGDDFTTTTRIAQALA